MLLFFFFWFRQLLEWYDLKGSWEDSNFSPNIVLLPEVLPQAREVVLLGIPVWSWSLLELYVNFMGMYSCVYFDMTNSFHQSFMFHKDST